MVQKEKEINKKLN